MRKPTGANPMNEFADKLRDIWERLPPDGTNLAMCSEEERRAFCDLIKFMSVPIDKEASPVEELQAVQQKVKIAKAPE